MSYTQSILYIFGHFGSGSTLAYNGINIKRDYNLMKLLNTHQQRHNPSRAQSPKNESDSK